MNNNKMSFSSHQSRRINSIIRVPKGNDWHIQLLVSEEGSDLHIDLHDVSDLKVELIHQRCGRAITPPYSIGVSGALQIELEAHQQELGLYDARISFTRPNSKYSDGLEHRTISVRDAIKVVHAHEGGDKGVTITAQMASIAKGDKGDPGDPMELLDELSRQQSVRMDEIATAQSVSLTSIGSRLSDEQRTALEELAGRLSREQAGQIAQQTERLSTEQASGLQTISDRLSSEQTQTLERQGQERATAQRSALEAIPAKVTDEVARLMPEAVDGKLPSLVDAKLPPLVDERIAGAVETAMPNQLTTALPPVVRAELPSAIRGDLPALVRPAIQPAVEQVMATDLASRVAQGLKIGGRNYAISRSSSRRLAGVDYINLYDWLPAHEPVTISLKYRVEDEGADNTPGIIILPSTNEATPKHDGVWEHWGYGESAKLSEMSGVWVKTIIPRKPTNRVYIAPGVTWGLWRPLIIDRVKVERGNVRTDYTLPPSYAYVNLCKERLVALSQGRSQLWAQYGKIVPNSSLSSEAQTAVERLWTNYDGAYNRLRKALQDVVNQPSEQAYAALSSLSDQYQTAASDLQAGMTEAMLSIASGLVTSLVARVEALERRANDA